jgi:biopolymer transport protein ExbD
MALGTLHEPGPDEEHDEGALFSEINITPLTDIFMVMLIIFMVAAAGTMEKQKEEKEKTEALVEEVVTEKKAGIKVNLPSGSAQDIDPTEESLVVTILPSGEVIVNDTTVDETDLESIFRRAFAKNQNIQVILRADSGVNHGRVVGVMDRAKRVGITRLGIGTAGGGG